MASSSPSWISRFSPVLPDNLGLSLATLPPAEPPDSFAPNPASLTALSVIWMLSRTTISAVSPLVLTLLRLLSHFFPAVPPRLAAPAGIPKAHPPVSCGTGQAPLLFSRRAAVWRSISALHCVLYASSSASLLSRYSVFSLLLTVVYLPFKGDNPLLQILRRGHAVRPQIPKLPVIAFQSDDLLPHGKRDAPEVLLPMRPRSRYRYLR